MITQELVRHLFNYEGGILTWKNPTSPRFKPGDVAGTVNCDGYSHVMINRKIYKSHRLIYLYHYGNLPDYLDHIDGNRSNNKVENLRECTTSQNNCNAGLSNKNTSGAKGVSWHKHNKKWQVQIKLNKKLKHIGYFDDFELAELVAIEARNKYYKEFARHV